MNHLDEEQKRARDTIVEGRSAFALGGYAGTGKTMTAAAAAQQLGRRAVLLAPTNKAAAVLAVRTKMEVSTIHKRTLKAVPKLDPKTGAVIGVTFEPGEPYLPKDAVVIVDEASMVGHELWDLMQQSIGDEVPVTLVGDPFQLPPINDDSLFNRALEAWPSITLTKVYRQASGSRVLEYATELREDWKSARAQTEAFDLLSPVDTGFLGAAFSGKAVVLCHTNDLRMTKILQMRRAIFNYDRELPYEGEPMIAYASSPAEGIINGFRYTVVKAEDVHGRWVVTLESEFGGRTVVTLDPDLVFDPAQKYSWYPKQRANPMDRTAPVTFGYAMTIHASQGSQWQWVMVERKTIDSIETARLIYTATTRAEEEVYVL